MTNDVRVGISADPSQVVSALDQVERKATETGRKVAQVGGDSTGRTVEPPSLGAGAARANADIKQHIGLLNQVDQAHKSIFREADKTARAMERAAAAAREVVKAGGGTRPMPAAPAVGPAEPPTATSGAGVDQQHDANLGRRRREQREIRQDTEASAKAQQAATKATREWLELSKNRPKATEYEAEAMHAAFRQRQRYSPYMKGFDDISSWESGVRGRFSDKVTGDRHVQDEIQRMRAMAFGMGPAGGIPWGKMAGVAGGVLTGAMTGGGGMWGNIGTATGSLLGLIPGAGALLGPLAGGALGAVGGMIDKGTVDATSTAIDLSSLQHAVGDASIEFEHLRNRVEAAGEGLGVAYVESAKFAKQYAEISNLQRDRVGGLGDELRTAIGLSRGFGSDPQSGVNFMGQMRLMGQFSDDKGAKKLAVQIAQAVDWGGTRSKMDEVLSAITGWAQQSTRVTMGAPDVSAFATKMSVGTETGLPGLTPAGAANILGRADASMRQGGGFGDVSKIVTMGAIGATNDKYSVFDVESIMEGGLFGNAEKTFGEGTIRRRRAEWLDSIGDARGKNELQRFDQMLQGPSAGTPNYKLVMDRLRSESMGDDDYLARVKNNFGFQSYDQAASFDRMIRDPRNPNAMVDELSRLGIDIGKMKMSSIGGISDVMNGDRDTLNNYAAKLREGKDYSALSKSEEKRLAGAMTRVESSKSKSDYEQVAAENGLRAELIKLLSNQERQESVGDRALNLQTSMRNATQRLADELIPATHAIKGGILALVEEMAPDSRYLKLQREANAKENEAMVTDMAASAPGTQAEKDLFMLAARRKAAAALGQGEQVDELDERIRLLRDEAVKNGAMKRPEGREGEAALPVPKNGAAADEAKLPGTGGASGSAQDFYAKHYPDALAAAKETGNPNPEQAANQILMQDGLETGFGKRAIPGTNNMGNIKAGSSWKGSTVQATDNTEGSVDPYRVYATPKDAFKDQLMLPRYADLYGKPDDVWAQGLQDRGYATDPAYKSKLLNMPKPVSAEIAAVPAPKAGSSGGRAMDPGVGRIVPAAHPLTREPGNGWKERSIDPGKGRIVPAPTGLSGAKRVPVQTDRASGNNVNVQGSARIVVDVNGKETAVDVPLKSKWNDGRARPGGASGTW